MRIEPWIFVFIQPGLHILFPLDRPVQLFVRQQGILRDHDPRDRIDLVLSHRIQHHLQPLVRHRAIGIRTNFLRQRNLGVVQDKAAVVLDVDHQRIHLGALRNVDELPHLGANRGPSVDVQPAQCIRRRHANHWRWRRRRDRSRGILLRRRGRLPGRTGILPVGGTGRFITRGGPSEGQQGNVFVHEY